MAAPILMCATSTKKCKHFEDQVCIVHLKAHNDEFHKEETSNAEDDEDGDEQTDEDKTGDENDVTNGDDDHDEVDDHVDDDDCRSHLDPNVKTYLGGH